MRSLRGRVAACSKLVISGWALSSDDDNYRPELEIIQCGRVVQTFDTKYGRSRRSPRAQASKVKRRKSLPLADYATIKRWDYTRSRLHDSVQGQQTAPRTRP